VLPVLNYRIAKLLLFRKTDKLFGEKCLTLHADIIWYIMTKKNCANWVVPKGKKMTEKDRRILAFQEKGYLVPTRQLIKSRAQIAGIRESGKINTGVLDYVAEHIKAGVSTADIDKWVYAFTTDHDAIPAPLNYEGFPKSVCTSVNEEVCHGIPSNDVVLEDGDIVNVDVSTIYKGYYSDASRMFIIGKTTPEKEKLVRVAKECLDKGAEAAQAYGFVGDIAHVITEHAHQNGFSVVRDYCGHGVGLEFHEEPEVFHFGKPKTGMLLVPGMVFTIEPMINMGTWEIFIDEENDWTAVTEDELPSAQWEHTFLMTDNGVETLTY